MKPDLDTSHLGPERKGTPTDITPVHAFDPKEVTRYGAPPKGSPMFPNVKLPHWLSLVVSLVAMVVAWLMARSASGDIVLPAVVLSALPLINSVLGMLSPAVSPATNLRAVKRAGMAVAALCFVLGGALACQACTKSQGTAVEVAGIDATICVLNHLGEDPGKIAIECALSSVTDVQRIIDAHKAAEIRERAGLVDAGAP